MIQNCREIAKLKLLAQVCTGLGKLHLDAVVVGRRSPFWQTGIIRFYRVQVFVMSRIVIFFTHFAPVAFICTSQLK